VLQRSIAYPRSNIHRTGPSCPTSVYVHVVVVVVVVVVDDDDDNDDDDDDDVTYAYH
jgi:hypothetical protein